MTRFKLIFLPDNNINLRHVSSLVNIYREIFQNKHDTHRITMNFCESLYSINTS